MREAVFAEATTDGLEQIMRSGEATIARIRSLQLDVLRELDRRQVRLVDGARTLIEWTAARLDLAPETSQRLVQTARRLEGRPRLTEELGEGRVSFDRAAEESRLHASGADRELVDRSRGWDVAGVRRMVARHRRYTSRNEQQTFRQRFLTMQPTLDRGS